MGVELLYYFSETSGVQFRNIKVKNELKDYSGAKLYIQYKFFFEKKVAPFFK